MGVYHTGYKMKRILLIKDPTKGRYTYILKCYNNYKTL